MHNFPKKLVFVVDKAYGIKIHKEVAKLCIDNDVKWKIDEILVERLFKDYPYLAFDTTNGVELSDFSKEKHGSDEELVFVSLNEFKNFLRGKGDTSKIAIPFEEELNLNGEYKAVVTKQQIKVGCQYFTHEKLAELYAISLLAQKSEK